jgi:ATP-dependent helicase/DNAse subunit B
MSIYELHDLLSDLRDQTDSLDMAEVEKREHLTEIIENLEEQIVNAEHGSEVHSHITDLLEERALVFGDEHPTISAILSNIINTLNNIGV